jgi:hypothetical protein
MRLESREDYEKLASLAIEQFMDGSPLNDSIAGISCENELNPEQIKRLVEIANTGAFLESFKDKAGEDDRMVEFDVADPTKIIEMVHAKMGPEMESEEESEDPSEGQFFDDVADSNREDPEMALYEGEEEEEDSEEEEKTASLREKHGFFQREALKDRLLDKKYQASMLATELAEKVAAAFKGTYSRAKYPEFSKAARATHGTGAEVLLRHVDAFLGEDSTKTASYLPAENELFSGKLPHLDKVAQYLEAVEAYQVADRALKSGGFDVQ